MNPDSSTVAQATLGAAADRHRALREASLVGALVTAVVFAAIAGLWSFAEETLTETYHAQLTSIAQSAATVVDPALHATLRRPGQTDSPAYRAAVAPLRRMREGVPDIRFLYTLVRDGDDVRIVLDAADAGDHNGDGVEDRSPIGDLSWLRQPAKLAALGLPGIAPRAGATDEPYEDDWGVFMTGYAPFFDALGRPAGAVAVDVDARQYLEHIQLGRLHMLQGLAPAGLLILALSYGIFRLRWRALSSARAARDAARLAQYAARHDKLTGLANRTAFLERLQAAVDAARDERGTPFALLFLDFDHFKHVNDTLGHEAGDELLRQISLRLEAALTVPGMREEKQTHLAARLGGDEFVILLDAVRNEAAACAVASGLLNALGPAYSLRGVEVHSSASIGVVTSGEAQDDAETLLHHADVAMYEAKHAGRGCFVVFDAAMRARITRSLQLERSLMGAIGTPAIRLCYQPIVELESGRMVAAEALLRWRHPVLGDVPPVELVAMAQETGLMVPLGDWVVRESCRQLAQWRRVDPERAPQSINVNVSRAEMALGQRLVDSVRSALTDAQLAPQRLQLEINERDLLGNRAGLLATLEKLRQLGVRLSMDEFGTGTTSLAGLRGQPFDTVKIDRSFVRGLASNRDVMALVHATLALVENLGMASVAEGVEDPAQLAILQSLGCRYAQGRLLGEPVAGAELLATGGTQLELHDAAGDPLLSPASAA